MGMTEDVGKRLKGGGAEVAREYARISKAVETFGISRTRMYGLAAAGKITFLKMGGATLIDCASVRAYIASLPKAEVRQAA